MHAHTPTLNDAAHGARGTRWLLVVAAPIEAEAIASALGGQAVPGYWDLRTLSDRFDIVVSGVGKANAAGATAAVLNSRVHRGVVSLGVGGALLDTSGAPCANVLEAVVATQSLFADEGIERDDGWSTIASLGFPPCAGLAGEPGTGVQCTSTLVESLRRLAHHVGPIATVSTCSATDHSAHAVRARTGAIAEAMEGAAVGVAARRAWCAQGGDGPCPFVEVRVMSNLTGSAGGAWQLKAALERLADLARVL